MSVPSRIVAVYDQPHQFEPLLPQQNVGGLVELTRSVLEKSYRLQHAVAPQTRDALRRLVRGMNSYYSNRIEGQGTHPQNIERALRADFSESPDVAKRQRIALAHIDAEQELEASMPATDVEAHALQSAFLLRAHDALYRRLDAPDRTTEDGRVIEPGRLRSEDVAVGRHQPPAAASVPLFLARMDQVYPAIRGLDSLLFGIAAAHHRAARVHPFGDGNGRACRLQTHCALLPVSAGLWSVNRGLARQRERYYEMLANADRARQGDLDGRGNLSERMLREWCEFFLHVADDQVGFMTAMLRLDGLRDRIAGLMALRSQGAQYGNYSVQATLPLHHVLVAGPLLRGEFIQMMGMPERSGRRVLSQLLKDGILVSDGPKGAVSFNFPLDALNILLPNLYPEAATVNTEP
ncbi:Fic family protein [Ramlibacter sp. XY19]|uniref:Fic family protein n=1 Tax=Ramlibacter paludis TaxID=2908000 RepID=UPI0023D9EF70|nr:Fic family protein [Ramlibacter paludis]MCG2593039.1 Fic family protein [Ramlibacter paludis]